MISSAQGLPVKTDSRNPFRYSLSLIFVILFFFLSSVYLPYSLSQLRALIKARHFPLYSFSLSLFFKFCLYKAIWKVYKLFTLGACLCVQYSLMHCRKTTLFVNWCFYYDWLMHVRVFLYYYFFLAIQTEWQLNISWLFSEHSNSDIWKKTRKNNNIKSDFKNWKF